jgi:two-component system, sensor histidine kinase
MKKAKNVPAPPTSTDAVAEAGVPAEDEPDVAEMMRARLEALGQEVLVASSGSEAIATALDYGPDLLLIDIHLPGMSGYDVAQRLRREGALAKATFVALTGFGDDGARRRCLEAGFERHFIKPIADEALLGLLRGA